MVYVGQAFLPNKDAQLGNSNLNSELTVMARVRGWACGSALRIQRQRQNSLLGPHGRPQLESSEGWYCNSLYGLELESVWWSSGIKKPYHRMLWVGSALPHVRTA